MSELRYRSFHPNKVLLVLITEQGGTGDYRDSGDWGTEKIATLDASYRGLVPHVPCVSVVCVCVRFFKTVNCQGANIFTHELLERSY